MRIRNLTVGIPGMIAAVVIGSGCSDNPTRDTGTSFSTSCGRIATLTQSYVHGTEDTLIAYTLEKHDTARSCIGSSLVETPSVTPADTDTIVYRVRDDSLFLSNNGLRALVGVFYDILPFVVYARVSGTAGSIRGQWRPANLTYEDPNNVLGIFGRAIVDSIFKATTQTYTTAAESMLVEISGTTIATFTSWNATATILAQWATESAAHAVTVDTVNACTVRLTGDSTAEEVLVWGDDRGVITFESSNTAHLTYEYYTSNPRSCPNSDRPVWWAEFLDANVQ